MRKKRKAQAVTRMDRYAERNKARGIVLVQVRIPECKRQELIALCAKWRQETRGGDPPGLEAWTDQN